MTLTLTGACSKCSAPDRQIRRLKRSNKSGQPNLSGHRIIPSLGKGIAPQYSPCRQKSPLKSAILLNSLQSVLRTGRNIGTSRALHRRYIFLVKPYHGNHNLFHHILSSNIEIDLDQFMKFRKVQ